MSLKVVMPPQKHFGTGQPRAVAHESLPETAAGRARCAAAQPVHEGRSSARPRMRPWRRGCRCDEAGNEKMVGEFDPFRRPGSGVGPAGRISRQFGPVADESANGLEQAVPAGPGRSSGVDQGSTFGFGHGFNVCLRGGAW